MRVKFLYATAEDIVKFACQKYSLGKIDDVTLTMDRLGRYKIIHEGKRYVITKEEEKQLAKEHIKEAIYCNEFKECCMSWFYSSIGDELLPKGMAIIDNELIQKASDMVGRSSEKDFVNRMADVIDKEADDEAYFIANLILAKEVASHMNGRAILWYGD